MATQVESPMEWRLRAEGPSALRRILLFPAQDFQQPSGQSRVIGPRDSEHTIILKKGRCSNTTSDNLSYVSF